MRQQTHVIEFHGRASEKRSANQSSNGAKKIAQGKRRASSRQNPMKAEASAALMGDPFIKENPPHSLPMNPAIFYIGRDQQPDICPPPQNFHTNPSTPLC